MPVDVQYRFTDCLSLFSPLSLSDHPRGTQAHALPVVLAVLHGDGGDCDVGRGQSAAWKNRILS